MNRVLRAGVLITALALAVGVVLTSPPRLLGADGQQVASVEQLKAEAFAFPSRRTLPRIEQNTLLSQAAAASPITSVEKMAGWASTFEQQREEFATEREDQYKKALGNVELLLTHNHPDYAIDVASRAYLLAADKEAFRNEPGVDQMIKGSIDRATQYDAHEQWVKSLRIYSDLASIEPAIPDWKDKLKLSTRRVRLLALYTPDVLKTLQDGDSKERDEVEALLRAAAATQPTTQPAAPATA